MGHAQSSPPASARIAWSPRCETAPVPRIQPLHMGAPRGHHYDRHAAGAAASEAAASTSGPGATAAAAVGYRRHTAPHAGAMPGLDRPPTPPAAGRAVARPPSHHYPYRQFRYPPHRHAAQPNAPLPARPEPRQALPAAPQRGRYMYVAPGFSDGAQFRPADAPRAHQFSRLAVPGHYMQQPVGLGAPAAQVADVPVYAPRRMMTAEEKEIRRKISHSAIEKRRRERTNAVLRDLQDIIPGLPPTGKIQKLEILEAATEYIRQLKHAAAAATAAAVGGLPQPAAGTYPKQLRDGARLDMHHRLAAHDRDAFPGADGGDSPPLKLPAYMYAPDRLEPRPENSYSYSSETSDTTRDGSGEDTLANPAGVSPAPPESPLPSPGPDPSSMDVNFLLS
ncbi:hypothetical protein H4R18_002658 [Coemansia javaensis]|uniref:BHLH domain-containing protein n=1 Tax=Coemansia javaensis TaxID=2761396 RepID=A0A9W8HE25_9FUNG|nr:hypothetical protein H4R18_002658 [Coemansia javaensis]